MCWLRVPTLLEDRGNTAIFEPMAAFAPRLLVRRRRESATSQADALLAGATAYRSLGTAPGTAG